MNIDNVLVSIKKILVQSKLFDEDKMEEILENVADVYNEDYDEDDDDDEEDDETNSKQFKEVYESIIMDLKPQQKPVSAKPPVAPVNKPLTPSMPSGQSVKPPVAPVNKPSTPLGQSRSVSAKPPIPQGQSQSQPKLTLKPSQNKMNIDQSIVMKTAVITQSPSVDNTKTGTTIQRIINFNIETDPAKNRTKIINFGEQCSSLGINGELASNNFASGLKTKKAYAKGVLVLGNVYTKEQLQSKFKEIFTKK
jgi:hypothetical protein